ncbi:hypothetical protein I6F07_09965 [Ensifer sp. IC4062]|nr:hypothetical protein [Ensifer sp. IC4062]MCA1440536.1 hypothetical protein [Ensifer sp. IC4062]
MKTFATHINAIAFLALFVAYASGVQGDRPNGVRRALQTYGGQLSLEAFPTAGLLLTDTRRCGRGPCR